MRDYRELVFSVLDELKITSDDSIWEPEHIISLLNKYRGLLFTQKYKGKKTEIPFAYYQRLNVYFDTEYSDGSIYQSIKELPQILDITNLWQYTFAHNDGMRTKNINFINPQRFKEVGYNKWLKNQVYITIDLDNRMYAKSPATYYSNLVLLVAERNQNGDSVDYLTAEDGLYQLASEALGDSYVYYDTILDNPIDGYRFNDDNSLDVLDFKFPCEESLIQPIIDLCLKELGVANSQPKDMSNNAVDDFSLPKQQQ